MNAIQNLRQTESRLVAAIAETTAAIDSIGTGRVDAALADLETAIARARGRLDAALGFLQAVVGGLASDFDAAAVALEEDATADRQTETAAAAPAFAQGEPGAAASVPATDATTPEATQEAAEATSPEIGMASTAPPSSVPVDAIGTDGSAVEPVNRVAEVLDAVPSANGRGKGHGRRRKGK